MRAFGMAWVFSMQLVNCAARGGGHQEKLTQDLILAASPFVREANNGWQPSSLARQILLSSGGSTTWRRRADSEEGRRQQQEQEEQARRGGRSLYSPYSPGADALRCILTTFSPTKDFFLFTLWSQTLVCIFVFAVCSVSILNNKPVRETPRWR